MRRKNLYITEVDVYLVGISLSNKALAQAKDWHEHHKDKCTLVSHLYNNTNKFAFPSETAVSATLKLQRTIYKDQFITAFADALKGCSPDAITEFNTVMGKSIEQPSVTTADQLVLYWLDNGEFVFCFNGVFGDVLTNQEVNKRLLEVYLDPARTVCKELYVCFDSHIDQINA